MHYSEPEFNYILYLHSLNENDGKTYCELYYGIIQREFGSFYQSEIYEVRTPEEMRCQFQRLHEKCCDDKNCKPLIFLDMHGSLKDGIQFNSGLGVMLWKEFNELCLKINIASANNLVIIMTLCFGLHTILEDKMTGAAPYSMIIGSDRKVYVYNEIKENISSFLTAITSKKSIGESLGILSGSSFICAISELLIYNLLIKYEITCCNDQSLENRWNNIIAAICSGNKKCLRNIRKEYMKSIHIDRKKIIKYRDRYLCGTDKRNENRYCVSESDIIDLIKKSQQQKRICQFRPQNDTTIFSDDEKYDYHYIGNQYQDSQ